MNDQVERLRQTAKFVTHATGAEHARWINEAADEIERLREQLEFTQWEWNRATEGMKERDKTLAELRSQLVSAKRLLRAVNDIAGRNEDAFCIREAAQFLSDEPECRHEDYCLHPKCECAKTDEIRENSK